MKTKIQEAEVEPAELETVTPLTYDQLVADLEKASDILVDDFSHFIALSLQDKRRFSKIFKRLNPRPEFKDDYKWLCDFMKEEIEADEKETTEGLLEDVTKATTAEELGKAAEALANHSVETSVAKGSRKDIDLEKLEELAATLKTKTAVAQAFGFYGAPGFNNRLATDPAIKAAYERGIARRANETHTS